MFSLGACAADYLRGGTATATRMIVWRLMLRIRFLILACVALWQSPVRAQHTIQVRTASSIRPDDSASTPATSVSGTLVDDVGQPLAEQPLRLVAEPPSGNHREGRTDDSGHFDLSAAAAGLSDDDVRVRFDGSANIDATEWSLTAPRSQKRCEMFEPADGRVDLDQREFTLAVRLLPADAPPTKIAIMDERGHELVRSQIAGGQPVRVTVATARLAPVGIGRLTVKEVADDGRPSATIGYRPLLRFRSTAISGFFEKQRGRTVLRGVVRDQSGRGLADQTVVALTASGAHVAAATTGEAGAFTVALPHGGAIASGSALTVKHESNAPWWLGGSSPQLVVPAPGPSYPPWWSLAGLAAAAAAFSWSLGRLARRLPEPTTAGKSTQKNVPASQARTRKRHGVVARVVNAATNTGVGGAVVEAHPSGSTPVAIVVAAADGWFELPDLPGGDLRLDVSMEGYESRSISLHIPHDGRWHDATILLDTLRSVALRNYERAFRRTAQARMPHLTPRERLTFLSASIREESGDGRVLQLTRAFERAYYGRQVPTAEQLGEIRALADVVRIAEAPGSADSFDAPSGVSL